MVKIIACAFIIGGLWYVGEALYPLLFLRSPFSLKILPLVAGFLWLYAGVQMFRLREAGREVLIVLAAIGAVKSTAFVFRSLFFWKEGFTSEVHFLEDVIFRSGSLFFSAEVALVSLAVNLGLVSFLLIPAKVLGRSGQVIL